MIRRIVILLILYSCSASKTSKPMDNTSARPSVIVYTPYVATWICENETFVQSYKLQKNRTQSVTGWSTIGQPILPKKLPNKNIYTLQLPKTSISNYYRVLATAYVYDTIKKKVVTGTFPTLSIFLSNTNLK